MNCRYCGSNQTCVDDSRSKGETVMRRRRCLVCNQIFKTVEMYDTRNDIKRGVKLEAYNEAISAIERLKSERTV